MARDEMKPAVEDTLKILNNSRITEQQTFLTVKAI